MAIVYCFLAAVVTKTAVGPHSQPDSEGYNRWALPALGLLLAAAFGLRSAWLAMSMLRERIICKDGRIVWRDWTGRERLNISSDEVSQGGMTWSIGRAAWGGSQIPYRVETSRGPIRWSSDIEYCEVLCLYMRGLSKQPFLPIPQSFSAPVLTSERTLTPI